MRFWLPAPMTNPGPQPARPDPYHIANMVNGVVNGYEKKLEIVGVGMRCQKQGSNLVMNLGFSHQVNIPDTEDCIIVWQDPNHFSVTGIDKQKSASMLQRSAARSRLSRTRARASATLARSSSTKKARPVRQEIR